ncbi:hypothetical protein PAMP_004293 [Pampus punctatissimus]
MSSLLYVCTVSLTVFIKMSLKDITDYRSSTSTISASDSLPDDLNTFYTQFETSSPLTERPTDTETTTPPYPAPVISPAQVNKVLRSSKARQHPWTSPQGLC